MERARLYTILLLVSTALVCGQSALASEARAANTVTSIPGEVVVNLDDNTSHSVVVYDSLVTVRPDKSIYLGGFLPALRTSMQTLRATPNPWLLLLQVSLTAGAVALEQMLVTGTQPEYRVERVVVVAELEGHPLTIATSSRHNCRPLVRQTGGGSIPNAVTCKILPANLASDTQPDKHPVRRYNNWPTPALAVVGGANYANKVWIRQQDPTAFRSRIVWGGRGDDLIVGSPFDDELVGMTGNDHINGRAGDDWIMGLQGHFDTDSIIGNDSGDLDPAASQIPDNDKLYGGPGNDVVWGYRGNDLVSGGGDSDDQTALVSDAPGSFGAPGKLITVPALFGGSGSDTVVGGSGADRIAGGIGRDAILARESDFGQPDVVDLMADCGPNLSYDVGGVEAYRASELGGRPTDPIATCTRRIPDTPPLSYQLLSNWLPGQPWFWW